MDKIHLKAFCLALLLSAFAIGCADKSTQIATNDKSESSAIQSDKLGKNLSTQNAKSPENISIAKLFEFIESKPSTASQTKQTAQKSTNQKNIAKDSHKIHAKNANNSQKIQVQNAKDSNKPKERTLQDLGANQWQDSTKNLPNQSISNAQDLRKSNDLQIISQVSQTPQITQDSSANQTQTTQDSSKIQAQDSQDLSNSQHIVNPSAPKARFSFNADKLNAPLPHLQTDCDTHDLQKCEDLGRIYAVQEKRDLAVAHYKRACDGGKGLIMPCFFLSLIYANNGDSATSREYLGLIENSALESRKIDEAELLLSIGEIALIKEKLQNFCANDEPTSCKILSSVFKIRGEMGEARAFFEVACKRGTKMPCDIVKTLDSR